MQQSDRQRTLDIIKHLLQTPDGELLMQELEDACDVVDLFNDDPYRTAYNCGRRDVYRLLKEIRDNPEIEENERGNTRVAGTPT